MGFNSGFKGLITENKLYIWFIFILIYHWSRYKYSPLYSDEYNLFLFFDFFYVFCPFVRNTWHVCKKWNENLQMILLNAGHFSKAQKVSVIICYLYLFVCFLSHFCTWSARLSGWSNERNFNFSLDRFTRWTVSENCSPTIRDQLSGLPLRDSRSKAN